MPDAYSRYVRETILTLAADASQYVHRRQYISLHRRTFLQL